MKYQKHILAERLCLLRSEMGISQYQLAERLGFSRGLVANYEQGRREPDYETLMKIASFYHVSIDYLLGRVNDKYSIYSGVDSIELIKKISQLKKENLNDLTKYIDLLLLKQNVSEK